VLLDHLPRTGLILDAGCGTAKWPMYLGRRGFRVIGVDISREACAIARRADPGVALVIGDTRRSAIRDHVFDAVISLGVVEHEEKGPDEGLRELHRVLKPGGTLVLDVPFNNPLRRLGMNHVQSWMTRKRRRAGWPLGFAEYRFSLGEVRRYLRRANFTPLKAYPNDLYPPRNMGIAVDYRNIQFNPLRPPKHEELFVLPGMLGRVANTLMRWTPWLVAGSVVVVARADPAQR
jgi:SAM-dependent methyltransferase